MCPGNALGEYVFQEREALGLKQHVHVARADAEMGRDGLRSQIGPVQVPPHERLGGDQSCRAHPAALGGGGRVARRPERKGKKVVDVSNGKPLQLGRNQPLHVIGGGQITQQQSECRIIGRNRPRDRGTRTSAAIAALGTAKAANRDAANVIEPTSALLIKTPSPGPSVGWRPSCDAVHRDADTAMNDRSSSFMSARG